MCSPPSWPCCSSRTCPALIWQKEVEEGGKASLTYGATSLKIEEGKKRKCEMMRWTYSSQEYDNTRLVHCVTRCLTRLSYSILLILLNTDNKIPHRNNKVNRVESNQNIMKKTNSKKCLSVIPHKADTESLDVCW